MNIKRGEIYYIEQYNNHGTEQSGGRPFVVVSPNELLTNGTGALCVPLTTKSKKLLPQHTTIHSTRIPSTALCEQARYISENLFGDYYCTVTDEELVEIEKCLLEAEGITGDRLKVVAKEMGILTETQTTAKSTKGTTNNQEMFEKVKEMLNEAEKSNEELTKQLSAKDIEIIKLKAQNDAYLDLLKSKI